jgi:histidyl-tRNA synthetase
MSTQKTSLPRGTRDFGPPEMARRMYILDILKRNFLLYGFPPIETPAMENLSTLTGKYGDEGDQLIYKILNSRIHEHKNKDLLRAEFDLSLQSSRNSEELTEKALRYDLTVPFARFVVMNQHKLVFPFRRSQVQPVWRADKPQRGRYREFYQCDADVVGSDSLVNELELMSLLDSCFSELKLPVLLKINNRKVLAAMAERLGQPGRLTDITVAIDKLDKIGEEGVKKELLDKGVPPEAIERLMPVILFKGDNTRKLKALRDLIGDNETGKKGLEEIEYLLQYNTLKFVTLELDISLARGLSYYTGTIFEAKANAGTFTPSIAGGGRYDDLTGIFGLKDLSGVGISFGIDRIYDVLEELLLFPEWVDKQSTTRVLLSHFDVATQAHALQLAASLRQNGICTEVYPDAGKKLGKQFEYANKKLIPFVCTVGTNEMNSGVYPLKNMLTGVQAQVNLSELITYLQKDHGLHN